MVGPYSDIESVLECFSKLSCIVWTVMVNLSCVNLMGMDTLSREPTLSELFYNPSEQGSTLKGKRYHFQKGLDVRESKQEVT